MTFYILSTNCGFFFVFFSMSIYVYFQGKIEDNVIYVSTSLVYGALSVE